VTPSSKEATSKFVHSFAQRYAQHHNKLCGGSGKLFEREYGAFPMSTEQSLARQLAYIDFNAVHHGLCRDPADYAWTTYGHHIGRPELSRIRRDLWTPLDWYLGLGEQRCELYRQWVNDCIALDRAEAPPRDFRLRRPNGSRAA
jgi:hypothetical protein